MNPAPRRLTAAAAAVALAATLAHADVSFVSTAWHATGTGKLVDPGFADLTDDYDYTEASTPGPSIMTLRNYPDFASEHNWIAQTFTPTFTTDDRGGGVFRMFTRVIGHINGPGSAVDGESHMTAHGTILITDTPTYFQYGVSTLGGGLTGINHRDSHLTIAPAGGSPIASIFAESSYGSSDSDLFNQITLDPGSYDIFLELSFQLHQADITGGGTSSASAEFKWFGTPAPGSASLLALALTAATRRKR